MARSIAVRALATAALALLAGAAAQEGEPPEDPPETEAEYEEDEIDHEELARERAERAREKELARLEEVAFLVCDRDANGWISFREANQFLDLDRGGFALYDRDRDGRIDREEFGVRYRAAVESGGTTRPALGPPPPAPGDPPAAWDLNGSGALELAEVRLWLTDNGMGESPEAIVAELDADGSGALELGEIERLFPAPPSTAEPRPEPVPRRLTDVFGGPEPRERWSRGAPLLPRIPSPATHFRRLDLDGDGFVEVADLAALRPSHVPVREAAVIAALDLDGDGRLSEEEFLAALGG